MSFVHLQVHSGYSLLNSAASVKELVKEAGALGYSSLALTDENVMYGAIEFYKACKANGIKPIIGLTASIYTDESELEAFPLVLLAATNAGYQNLLKISSALQSKSKGGIKQKWMKSYHEGLIAITPGEKGYIETLLQAGQFEKAAQTAEEFRALFGEGRFYLGYQPFKDNETLSEDILRLSRETEIAVCATGDVHYIRKEDQDAYRCLCAIKAGEKWADLSGGMPGLHLRSPEEMRELYAEHPEALEASAHIAKQCHVDVSLGQTRLPSFPAPNGKSADDYLADVCFEGLRRRFASPDDRAVRRLEYELDVIRRMRFSDYFLIVWDFMKYAHEQGIVTGPGRGSAAGSLVAYTLFITDVDPLKHSLLFERFLNPERISMPDIDIDFPDTRRDEVIQYVQKKYGSMHVAQIITFGTLAAKAALRDTGRVFGISPKEADQLARLIPSKPGMTLEEARRQSAQLNQRLSDSGVLAKIFQIAKKIEGLPRHTSTHAAGVVLSQEPLSEIVPLQEGHEGVYLTQYAMDHLEDLGLLKMDFLGLRNLTLIESIKTMIEKETNTKIDFSRISYQDEKTFTLLSKGDTTGIFQLESSGMRSVLKRLKPTRLEDIVAVNALYRPGPMENIPLFIDRKHGRARVEVPHEDVRSILAETYGVIVYQEQIMMIASRMAGFSLGEADLLRRAVSKKQKDILDRERSHFVEGCLKKEYSVVTANEVYDLIVKFANYGFNRSHAVAYSMIGYQLAYLKAHYPLYFMCGLLTSVIGNEDKISQYLYEAKGSGIEVLPPSVNSSSFPFTVENGAVRYSLRAIKNVGVSAVKDIYKARKHKPFEDLFDFCFRLPAKSVNRKTIEALIFSGAMDEFNQNRATLLASVDVALEHAELFRADDDQMGLFLEESFSIKPKYVEAEEFPLVDMLRFEKEALGVYFSSHPLSAFRDGLTVRGALPIAEARKIPKGQLSLGALLAGIKTIRTKTGQHMAFLTLSDETGEIEAIVFPDQFRRLSPLLKEGALLYAVGKMEQRQEKTQFIISAASILEQTGTDKAPSVYIKIEGSRHNQELLAKMKRILLEHKGETGVYLYYEKQKQTIKLPDSFHIQADHQALYRLKELLGQQNVVLK
ncbi:DNA polymerase III subunit alpha [Bacillus nakamurai]|uniref:DNA polymerase III subunit alpha n=1 Tax=Bacillus nakamurai TaxID=1793963 RepID=A0A150F3X7_9BACI|nr:DNA polymerase III subunit alpha [Bacillus nakamurai]KXZ13752.1 DNA polymerase III subunit alpha [Bacillus nakamurai]KXZ21322.1 DNA polymerase III subunit alpha [Bacillus nakamurai]MED1227297.1 DNA polymerase III subunit alpha [Bacillus nakamurai]